MMSNSGVLKGLSKFLGVYREFSLSWLGYSCRLVQLCVLSSLRGVMFELITYLPLCFFPSNTPSDYFSHSL